MSLTQQQVDSSNDLLDGFTDENNVEQPGLNQHVNDIIHARDNIHALLHIHEDIPGGIALQLLEIQKQEAKDAAEILAVLLT